MITSPPPLRLLPLAILLLTYTPATANDAPSDVETLVQRAAAVVEPRFVQRDADGQVTRIHLSNAAPFTDDDLLLLAKLPRLRQLSFRLGTKSLITVKGVAAIGRLTNLTILALRCNPLDDAVLEHVAPLVNLEELDLMGLHITSVGLPNLRPLTKLKVLNLAYNPIDDAAMARLPDLPNLQNLNLEYTDITDASLVQLKRFPNLKIVTLSSPIAPAAIDRLRAENPTLKIRYTPPHTDEK